MREGESVDLKTGEAKPWRTYAATVRVTVPGSPSRTDVGFQTVAEETAEGHETASKGAVTDALKRALRSYGDQFGNSLYGDGATGDLAPSRRKTLVDLGNCQGFDETKVRFAVRERTGRDLDELPVAAVTPAGGGRHLQAPGGRRGRDAPGRLSGPGPPQGTTARGPAIEGRRRLSRGARDPVIEETLPDCGSAKRGRPGGWPRRRSDRCGSRRATSDNHTKPTKEISMSRTINRVELLGRVGTDPELKYSQNGTAVCQLRLATDRRRQNGETEADWHSVVCWGKQAEAVAEYVKKGNRVFVAGSLAQNSYETDDGQRRHRTEVHAQEVIFLDSNGNGRTSGNGTAASRLPPRSRTTSPSSHPPAHRRRPPRAGAHGAAPSRGRPRFRSARCGSAAPRQDTNTGRST